VPSSGAFAVLSDNEHFQVFLNALQSRTAVKMLSAPHIIAADNREAHILVGESIPILTSTVTNVLTDNNGSAVNSVQYRDTGKILTVLPQVNSLGLVNLQIPPGGECRWRRLVRQHQLALVHHARGRRRQSSSTTATACSSAASSTIR
jgi:type II secretory pathway component GspD/PulD (secretin)